MFTSNVYLRVLYIFIVALIPFTIARIALHQIYNDDFQSLTFFQTLGAFIHGLRFDAAIIITYIGFPLIFLLLPFQWAKNHIWQQIWSWIIFFLILLFVFTLTVDLIYYEFVHRHAGPEIQLILGDVPLMLDIALTEHLFALILFVIISSIAAKIWHFSFQFPLAEDTKTLKNSFIVGFIFVSLIVVGRGGLQHKPIRISDAFASGSTPAAYLTINGTLAITQSLRGTKPAESKSINDEDARRITREFVKGKNESFVDQNFPLMRRASNEKVSNKTSENTNERTNDKPNIVVLLIESFDAIHFDAIRTKQGLTPYNATPNLDKLAENGILYTNFYAAGQRSVDGLAATLASVPTLPGFPYIGQGMEQNRLGFLGNFAKSQGYSTTFLQSSSRGSFHIDSIAAQAGFESYYGAEDIPPAHRNIKVNSNWGVWDHDTLQFAHQKFDEAKQPFLGFVFTSTTHTPWRIPSDKWKLRPSNSKRDDFLNTLYYLDWAIGQFMEKAKASDYYKNTIFIITGDHISHFAIDVNNPITQFHIPLIITGPGISNKIDTQVGNQMDIIPTIIDMANWNVSHSSLGRSLLNDRPDHFSFSVNGSLLSYIDNKNSLSINNQQKQNVSINAQSEEEIAKLRLTALQQTIFDSLVNNRLFSTMNIK
ncbi:MAG: sulfatase-like hydrolase/transferase [Gammaproteobacteria bacterium]|nr:sulfatase-like hydrolase/transferase [Gammaproteobacteria bacterium]